MPDGLGGHGPLPGRAVYGSGQQLSELGGPRPQAYRCRSRVAIPTHILTLGVSAPGEAEAKEGGGNKNNSSTTTEEPARRQQTSTDEGRINPVRTKGCARRQGPVTDDGKIKSSAAAGGCARRVEPDTNDAHRGNPANADERTGTDAEKRRAWEEDVHIGAEDSTVRSEIMDMLSDFKDMWSSHLGNIDTAKHRIELKPCARPIYQAPYRARPIAREKEKKESDLMLRAGVIEPTSAGWASPVVFIPKKDGTMRFCVDYRKLNAVTFRDSYPLPRMDEWIDPLGDATVFTTLDCNSGYWQVDIAEEDRHKIKFASHSGLYSFLRMPFGLKNAPATFHLAVDLILSRVKWETALVYLDYVIVHSQAVTEHMAHVRDSRTLGYRVPRRYYGCFNRGRVAETSLIPPPPLLFTSHVSNLEQVWGTDAIDTSPTVGDSISLSPIRRDPPTV